MNYMAFEIIWEHILLDQNLVLYIRIFLMDSIAQLSFLFLLS